MTQRERYSIYSRQEKRRRARWTVWNRIVLGIGYLTLAYNLVRGVIYLLVLAKEWTGK